MTPPTIGDEKDLVINMEAAPINHSDTGSVEMIAKFAGDSIAAGVATSTVAALFPQDLASMLIKSNDDFEPVDNEDADAIMVASSSPEAQVLLAKCVGVAAVSTYAQTPRPASATQCSQSYPTTLLISKRRVLVNPLTVLAFIHTTKQ